MMIVAGLMNVHSGLSVQSPARSQVTAEVQQHFHAARSAQERGDFDTAEAEYRSVLDLKPDFSEVYLNLGLIYYLQGKFEDSIKVLEKAVAMKPQMAGADLFLGIDYCKIDQYRRSLTYLERARQEQPASKEVSFWLATALLASGEHLKAASVLEQAAEAFPSDVDVLYLLGRAYQFIARDDFDGVKAVAPDSAYTHRILAESYVIGQMWVPAITHYKKLITIAPAMREVRVALGQVYLRQENLDEAEHQFRQELSLDPSSITAHMMLAETAIYRGNVKLCLQGLQHVIQANPWLVRSGLLFGDQPLWFERPVQSDLFRRQLTGALKELNADADTADQPATHLALALINWRLGQNTECHEQLKALRELLKDSIPPGPTRRSGVNLKRSGMLLVQSKWYPQAISDLRDYLRSNPTDHAARMALALALFEDDRYLESAKEYRRILTEQPRNIESGYYLGKCYEYMSLRCISAIVANQHDSYRSHQLLAEAFESQLQDEKALEEYHTAVVLRPSSPDLHLALARLLSKNMRLDEAIEEYHQELRLNPLDPEANAELGGLYVFQHDLVKGMPLLQLAIRLNPDLLEARRDLGKVYYLNGQYDEAEKQVKLALPADQDGSIYGLLANVYKKLGRLGEAQKAFDTSIKMKTAVATQTPQKLRSWER